MDDPGDPEADSCPICMCPMAVVTPDNPEEIAMLPCGHHYHDTCIVDWTRTATSCPYCRTEFTKIDILHQLGGATVRFYNIDPKVQEEQFSEDEVETDDYSDDSYLESSRYLQPSTPTVSRCIICGSQDREDVLMSCDLCDDFYHSFCLGLDCLPPGPFHCPTCVATNEHAVQLPSDSTVRTVANMRNRRSQRRRHRPPPIRRLQLETWAAAWDRVRARAWERLNEEIGFEHLEEDTRTPEEEEELRRWRVRMARQGPSSNRSSAVESTVPVTDPATANLWKAFEQASKFSKTKSRTSTSSKDSRNASPKSPVQAPEALLADVSADASGPSRPRQKRPNASNSSRKRPAAFDQPVEQSKRIALAKSDAPEGSFLTSLLSNIKQQPRDLERPVRVLLETANRTDRPLSPISNGPSASSSPMSSPRFSPLSSSLMEPDMPSPAKDKGKRILCTDHLRPLSPPADARITKSDIANLVSARLKPLYRRKELSKDEFIDINRDVTRRVFGEFSSRADLGIPQTELEKLVETEVEEELEAR